MTGLDEYQDEALRTAAAADLTPREVLAARALGLSGEAGEVADLVKKHLGHGHPLVREAVAEELGDVLWYVATLADRCGYKLSEIATLNKAKLRTRYPDGFSQERSMERSMVRR